jgi:hypothetical protein
MIWETKKSPISLITDLKTVAAFINITPDTFRLSNILLFMFCNTYKQLQLLAVKSINYYYYYHLQYVIQ